MKAVIDTNILIDFLNQEPLAFKELSLYTAPVISIITWIEILVGAVHHDEKAKLTLFLNRFEIIMLTEAIAEKSVQIRQALRLKLPDAIILATAQCLEVQLVTRNSKDFSSNTALVKIPYHLH